MGYTLLGGLRSVAYTDVVQLALVLLGLGLALPYALAATGGLQGLWNTVAGTADQAGALRNFTSSEESISWGDWTLVLMLGGIPWNVYFQRVLASRNENQAATLSLGAGLCCALMAVPPLILGLCALGLDDSLVGTMPAAAQSQAMLELEENPAFALPYLLRLTVPDWVAVLALGAVSAAVMSSVDSSILSASSLVAWNGYRLFRPDAGPRRIKLLVRGMVVLLGAAATAVAFTVQSVAALWYLCGDVVYCVLFPQLTLALFDRKANRTGALAGLGVSALLRLGGGEATLGLPAFLPYPTWTDGEFPFRTLAMVMGLAVAWGVSRITGQVDPPRRLRNPWGEES